MLLCLIGLLTTLDIAYSEDPITPLTDVATALERDRVILSCKYSGTTQNLFWYRQYPGSAPQFLIMEHMEKAGLSVKREKEKTLVHLKISSAEVADSALYYCALTGSSQRLLFGSAVNLIMQSREENKPSYFTLKDDSNTTACLATDFSNYNDTLNGTEPTRMQGDKYYSQVALNQQCPKESDKCAVDTHEIDLIILGLRILFMKTIVFNVLMTFRVWMG